MKRRPFWPQDKIKQPPREEIVIERPQHDLTIFKIHFGKLTVKLYSKGARVLRCEAIVHNTKALKGKRSLPAFPTYCGPTQTNPDSLPQPTAND